MSFDETNILRRDIFGAGPSLPESPRTEKIRSLSEGFLLRLLFLLLFSSAELKNTTVFEDAESR